MGLLTVGTPLSWDETKQYARYVRDCGVEQFICHYNKHKDRQGDRLYFGDEIEYTLVRLDTKSERAQLSLTADKYLRKLARHEKKECSAAHFTVEYGSYMIEGTPRQPYGGSVTDLLRVEDNMMRRRQHLLSVLDDKEETVMTLTAFPRLGCPRFTHPPANPQPLTSLSRSLWFPDEAIGSHPRPQNLTPNIRERRGEKVSVDVPIYKDEITAETFTDGVEECDVEKRDHIHMDSVGFGLGMCCLQTTFQASNLTEARYLHDQLAPLTPILMALTAASPVYRGYLSDMDHRWNIIRDSMDDRTAGERGLCPLKDNEFRIHKSRYDSIDCYLSPDARKYNDVPLVYDAEILERLKMGGVDHQLAEHVAHLFIRDTVSMFTDDVGQFGEDETNHFENIQSSNYQTMRFKPPPAADSNTGWRVEVRPMECQLTDFENAAFVVFVALLTKVIITGNLLTLIPISYVDKNVQRAQTRDAVLNQRFYFRTNPHYPCCKSSSSESVNSSLSSDSEEKEVSQNEYMQELTVDEIVNGSSGIYSGLLELIQEHLNDMEFGKEERDRLQQYLKLISRRAAGKLMTDAKYIREFVIGHPLYEKDSVVSEKINYDLLVRCDNIGKGLLACPELLTTVIGQERR